MTNLDLYAKAEHLLGIEDATEALYDLYRSELDDKDVKTLLDVGCGRGGFMTRMISDGVKCKGVDLSSVMVQECLNAGLDAECINAKDVDGKYDAIVSIFDVLNFMDKESLVEFLNAMADKLNDDGIFIADINTRYGFSDVSSSLSSLILPPSALVSHASVPSAVYPYRTILLAMVGACSPPVGRWGRRMRRTIPQAMRRMGMMIFAFDMIV